MHWGGATHVCLRPRPLVSEGLVPYRAAAVLLGFPRRGVNFRRTRAAARWRQRLGCHSVPLPPPSRVTARRGVCVLLHLGRRPVPFVLAAFSSCLASAYIEERKEPTSPEWTQR
jgi:hypothetical protein